MTGQSQRHIEDLRDLLRREKSLPVALLPKRLGLSPDYTGKLARQLVVEGQARRRYDDHNGMFVLEWIGS